MFPQSLPPKSFPPTIILAILFLSLKPIHSLSTPNTPPLSLQLDLIYRIDSLKWNKSSQNINILSELTWTNLKTLQPQFLTHIPLSQISSLLFLFAYGSILDGQNQDSDFFGNNRTLEYIQFLSSSKNGSMLDLSLGFQYHLPPIIPSIIPSISSGISYHQQNLSIQYPAKLVNTLPSKIQKHINFQTPNLKKLNSSYNTQWTTPWIKLHSLFLFPPFQLILQFQYNLLFYQANAFWNLRNLHFSHSASFGHGLNPILQIQINIHPHWLLTFQFQLKYWSIKSGTESEILPNDQQKLTPLRQVTWQNYSFHLGTIYLAF